MCPICDVTSTKDERLFWLGGSRKTDNCWVFIIGIICYPLSMNNTAFSPPSDTPLSTIFLCTLSNTIRIGIGIKNSLIKFHSNTLSQKKTFCIDKFVQGWLFYKLKINLPHCADKK